MRIKEYPSVDTISDEDLMIIETEDGTRKAQLNNIAEFIQNVHLEDDILKHKFTFRDKNLGSTFTNEQKQAIQNGTFEDLYVGDYWVINSIKWRIVDLDYFFSNYVSDQSSSGVTRGSTNKHHLIVMPDISLFKSVYNTQDCDANYISSAVKTQLNNRVSTIRSFFNSSPVMEQIFSNSNNNETISWYISDFELPSAVQLMGFFPSGANNRIRTNVAAGRFALFIINSDYLLPDRGMNYWVLDLNFERNGYNFNNSKLVFSEAPLPTERDVRPYFIVTPS